MLGERPGYIHGVQIVVDHMGPRFRLSDSVPMSDEFRAEMQAWCNEFFGWNPGVVKEGEPMMGVRASGERFYIVHHADYARLRRVYPESLPKNPPEPKP